MATSHQKMREELGVKERIAREDRESKERIADKDRKYKLGGQLGSSKIAEKLLDVGLKFLPGGGLVKTLMSNDVKWYNKVAPLDYYARIMAYFSQGWPAKFLGKTFDGTGYLSAPALLTLRYVKTFGDPCRAVFGDNSTSALNYSLNRLMTSIRSVTSVSSAIDVSILGLYLLAVSEVYDLAEELKTDIKLLNTNFEDSPALSELAFGQRGYSATEFSAARINLGNLCKRLMPIIERVNLELPIPQDFDLIRRRVLFRGLFIRDAEKQKIKPQVYQAYCDYVLKYDSASSSLVMEYLANTVSTRIGQLNSLIGLIVEDSDMQEMIRAIRSAVSTFAAISNISPEDKMDLWYDKNLLEQVHNVNTVIPMIHSTRNFYGTYAGNNCVIRNPSVNPFEIHTDSRGYLYQGCTEAQCGTYSATGATFNAGYWPVGPFWSFYQHSSSTEWPFTTWGDASANMYARPYATPFTLYPGANSAEDCDIINLFDEEVSTDIIVESTRLHNRYTMFPTQTGGNYGFSIGPSVVGTEVVEYIAVSELANRNLASTGAQLSTYPAWGFAELFSTYDIIPGSQDLGTLHVTCTNMCALSSFDWHPPIYSFSSKSGTPSNDGLIPLFGELRNFIPLKNFNLGQLHDLCVKSLLTIATSSFKFR